ncbi:MAG: NADH-quinone oxidoreductase subunit C, partial [Anaerolineales bacterium]|nr:NADH-quinone oxidoreductase subunit C [Anaerolineales bacterium]
MTAPDSTLTVDLTQRFPSIVIADERPGHSGFIVPKESLVEVATAIRDELGYDLLTAVTGVDYLPEEKMEVVYHAYKTTGGPGLVFKVQVPREDPVEVPSLIDIWPGVDLQEREAWDLLGIKFTGHPDLRRILLWDGFDGHPLRKDWQEGFYEEETKPFKSRWPDGQFYNAEEKNPFKDNLTFPNNFDPEKWIPEGEALLYGALARYTVKQEDGMSTDRIVINM